jgi:hypothetical protein
VFEWRRGRYIPPSPSPVGRLGRDGSRFSNEQIFRMEAECSNRSLLRATGMASEEYAPIRALADAQAVVAVVMTRTTPGEAGAIGVPSDVFDALSDAVNWALKHVRVSFERPRAGCYNGSATDAVDAADPARHLRVGSGYALSRSGNPSFVTSNPNINERARSSLARFGSLRLMRSRSVG